MMEPVGHASRHPACSQCLQTSEENSHVRASAALPPRPMRGSLSTNFTCRHVECPSARVLSYDLPLQRKPSSGTPFHSLHATSHALQPMQSVESVKKPVTVMTKWRARSVPGAAGPRPTEFRRSEFRIANSECGSPSPRALPEHIDSRFSIRHSKFGSSKFRGPRALLLRQPARDSLRLENPHVRLLRHRHEVVDDVTLDEAARAPVIREADVVDAAAADVERRHARGDEGARGDGAARGADAHDVAI